MLKVAKPIFSGAIRAAARAVAAESALAQVRKDAIEECAKIVIDAALSFETTPLRASVDFDDPNARTAMALRSIATAIRALAEPHP